MLRFVDEIVSARVGDLVEDGLYVIQHHWALVISSIRGFRDPRFGL